MNFNDYASSLENMQQEEVFIQLQTLYAEQEVLLQYFEGVNKQFQNWLNAKPFNALVVAGILPKLEPVLLSLARLRFQLMDMEEEELAPQTLAKLAKLKRNITSIMTYQEVDLYENRLSQLAEQDATWQQENAKKADVEAQERLQQAREQQQREKQAQQERDAKERQQREREEKERQQKEREKQLQWEREEKERQQKTRERQLLQELKTIFEDNSALLGGFKGVSVQFERMLNPASTVPSVVEELVKQHRKILSDLQGLKLLLFEMQQLQISQTLQSKWSFLQKDTQTAMTWQQIPTFTAQWNSIAAENKTLRQQEIQQAEETARQRQNEAAQQHQAAAGLNKTFQEEPEMIRIQGGTFMMCNEQGYEHQVTLSAFAIGKYPITQREWKAVMGTNPAHFKGDNLPVERVSWEDAQLYIAALKKRTGKNYRLSTEAEWEYAARGGQAYEYGSSNDINAVAWYSGNSGNTTHAVGTKQPNGYGLHDMLGNVWEWCQDWYGKYPTAPVTNPIGAATGSDRVRRGGSWCDVATGSRPACRYGNAPTYRGGSVGFRVCLSLQ